MSVAATIVTRFGGVVASDGRLFSSAKLAQDDSVIEPAEVTTDRHDKSFSACSGKVIGGFCGLMDFAGKPSSDHITEALENAFKTKAGNVAELAETVSHDLKHRLAVEESEVLFRHRKLTFFFLARNEGLHPHLAITKINLHPDAGEIAVSLDSTSVQDGGKKRYYVIGEPKAQQACAQAIETNQSRTKDLGFLKMLAKKSISLGIKSAADADHLGSSEQSCGGSIFIRDTKGFFKETQSA